MSIATWIGRRLADVVTFLRDKPFIPCQLDWYSHNVEALFATPEQKSEVTKRIFDRIQTEDAELLAELDDGCGTCDTACCVATDTLGEFRLWNQRK
jgi:hypothetical protein